MSNLPRLTHAAKMAMWSSRMTARTNRATNHIRIAGFLSCFVGIIVGAWLGSLVGQQLIGVGIGALGLVLTVQLPLAVYYDRTWKQDSQAAFAAIEAEYGADTIEDYLRRQHTDSLYEHAKATEARMKAWLEAFDKDGSIPPPPMFPFPRTQ